MPSTDSLLQLRSNAPGLPGPYLQENLAPYQLLDAMGKASPRSILAIGGRAKSQYLAREFSTTIDHHETPSVALASLDHKTIWLDCELHSHQMPRIKAKSSTAGCSRLHFLNSTAARVAKIAYPIYTDVLALFSDVILIFVPDFGGLPQVVELLSNWIKSSIEKGPQAYSRIILLHREVVADTEVKSLVLARLASHLRASCPTEAYSSKAMMDMMNKCFRIHNLPLQSGHRQWLLSEVAAAFHDRRRRGLHFKAHHFKWLLQAGISQYAEQPSVRFNPISSSRLQCLLPERLGDCLATFLGGVKTIGGSEINLVASALVMDAYPPGMHCECTSDLSFLPEALFERLYAGPAKECEKIIKLPGLAASIKRDFITLVGENREIGVEPVQTHLGRVQGNPTMRCTYHESICAFCIIQIPMFTLDCRHRLCETCILSHGTSLGSWRVALTCCPVCQGPNTPTIILRPPTASKRVLNLGGGDAEKTMQFLRDLERSVGVHSIALRELFDGIIGSDIGMSPFAPRPECSLTSKEYSLCSLPSYKAGASQTVNITSRA
ncbi:hypothetical protein EDB81DRAFT_661041 [Dactylonectria macrodidyma]|uniref:RING-type domain-containing protein n=1 Tax=Dactylonectria macrodidyma TaxID=307937 RepID=A0A9P9E5Z3_9HYPO|nr:hypothetical protein EDB81DRAFT_661041 [Dactylonectria macrodidyma]